MINGDVVLVSRQRGRKKIIIITTTDDVEDERNIWSEGWILGGYVDSSASPRWQPFTQTAEELSGTFVRAPGAEETEHPRESQSPGFGLVRRDSGRVFFPQSFGQIESFPLQLFHSFFSFFFFLHQALTGASSATLFWRRSDLCA